MSIIFGSLLPRGKSITEEELQRLALGSVRFAGEGTWLFSQERVGMGFQPYHTHGRLGLEHQPFVDSAGNIVCLDGRIDNYQELCEMLSIPWKNTPDSAVVLASYSAWGSSCFSKFIGDWAMALWSVREDTLYLARDHAGTRTLYFRAERSAVHWSTYLENLLVDGSGGLLDEEYVAHYLACRPIGELTPYKSLRAVPAAHYLAFRESRMTSALHWRSIAANPVRYGSDNEYEEQFLFLFGQSVERRIVAGAPILAHLSGGMDSSSIVCMADSIRSRKAPASEQLSTVSFFDDGEPNWHERPYFSTIERHRGKVGIHLPVSFLDRTFEPAGSSEDISPFPGGDSSTVLWDRNFQCTVDRGGFRAILSGIGGDEVLGGVPTPYPGLADELISWQLRSLFKNAISWCLVDRSPVVFRLIETIAFTAGLYLDGPAPMTKLPAWISPHLSVLLRDTMPCLRRRERRFGASPSAISNSIAWWSLLDTLPHLTPSMAARYEYRYPYLDRNLVDFLFRIPREQLVRPGRRRFLMRRSLQGIVPSTVLERPRKAYVIRAPLLVLQRSHCKLDALFANSIAASYGFIDRELFRINLHRVTSTCDFQSWPAVMRMIDFELWLRSRAG